MPSTTSIVLSSFNQYVVSDHGFAMLIALPRVSFALFLQGDSVSRRQGSAITTIALRKLSYISMILI
jgi:hypothetical protein